MLALLVLFVIAPLAELYVIVQVAGEIGALNTLALLFLVSLVGASLVKRQGLNVLRRMQEQVGAGKVPHNEVVDGFLILLAGALLIAPGFITDVFGVLLLLPPIRIGVRKLLLGNLKKRGALTFRVFDGFGRQFGSGQVFDTGSSEVDSSPPPRPELDP